MTEKEIDIMWNRALCEAVAADEPYTRHKFAASVEARVREECAHRAAIALLGADQGLASRVNQAIQGRENT